MLRLKPRPTALSLLTALAPLGLQIATPQAAQAGAGHNHGGAKQADLPAGEFRVMPVITLEGHGGYENNLTTEGKPAHYAIDAMVGTVMEWGLPNQSIFAIEASFGPAMVWGEAEHFYGRVHVESHNDEHREDNQRSNREHPVDDHDDEHHADQDHADEEHEDDSHDETGHDGHGGHAGHREGHSQGQPYRRIDMKGMLQARYQPNDRLTLSATWLPYYVSRSQGEDIQGAKHELAAEIGRAHV